MKRSRLRKAPCPAALVLVAALAAASGGPSPAAAQSYPAKLVRVIVPYAAGGATDVVARGLVQRLSDLWGQQVVIENKPGGNTQLGAEVVAKAPPDGYTLMVTSESTMVMNPSLYSRLPYDPVKDFVPITRLVALHQALVVHPSLPARDLGEVIALAKAKPGVLTYGTAGAGSASHLNMEMLQSMAGVKFVAVHYKGGGQALTDVIAGHINMMFISVGLVAQAAQAGQVRMLAVSSAKRFNETPDTPTVAESGLPAFEGSSWFGLFAPSGTPPEIVAKIHADVARIFADPDFRDRFIRPNLLEPAITTPEAFAASIDAGREKWREVIRKAGLNAN